VKTTQRPESDLTEKSRNRGGRPRKDEERDLVRKLKVDGETWKEIARKVNAQTHQNKTPEAYRALLKSCSVSAKLPGKNGRN